MIYNINIIKVNIIDLTVKINKQIQQLTVYPNKAIHEFYVVFFLTLLIATWSQCSSTALQPLYCTNKNSRYWIKKNSFSPLFQYTVVKNIYIYIQYFYLYTYFYG